MKAQAKIGAGSDKDPLISAAATEGGPSQVAPATHPEAIAHIMRIVSRDRVIRGGAKSTYEELAEPRELTESKDTDGKPSEDLPPETQLEEQPKSSRRRSRVARRKVSPIKKRFGIGSRVNNELEELDGETEDRWVKDREIKVHTTKSSAPAVKNPDVPEPLQVCDAPPVEPVLVHVEPVLVPDPGVNPILDPELQEVKEKLREFYSDMKVENKRLGQLNLDLQVERAALDVAAIELEKLKSEGLIKTKRVSLGIDDLEGQQYELRKQLEAASREMKLLEKERAEIEGVRRAVEEERLAVVRERVSADGMVERMVRTRGEIAGAQGLLRGQAEELAQTRIDIAEVKSQLAKASEIIDQRVNEVKQEEIRLLAQKDQLRNGELELERKDSNLLDRENLVAESVQQVHQVQEDIESKKVEYSLASAELSSARESLESRTVEFDAEQAKMRSQFEVLDSQRGEIERMRRDHNSQQKALDTAKASWDELRANQETELESIRSAVFAQQSRVAAQLLEVNQEVSMLSKSRESVEEERKLLAEARALVENDRKTVHQDAAQGESSRVELSTLRIELEETKTRLLDETSRRAQAEQGRQFAETYRPSASKDSIQNLFDDPMLARLLDQQWDLWLTDDHK